MVTAIPMSLFKCGLTTCPFTFIPPNTWYVDQEHSYVQTISIRHKYTVSTIGKRQRENLRCMHIFKNKCLSDNVIKKKKRTTTNKQQK